MPNDVIEGTLPQNIKVYKINDGIVVKKSWLHYSVIQTLIACLMWDGFVVYWYNGNTFNRNNIVTNLVALLPLFVGIIITYVTLAKIFNATNVVVTNNAVKIQIRPLPWHGNKTVMKKDIFQINTEYKRSVTDVQFGSYNVYVIDCNRQKHLLVNDLESPDQGLFIENAIKTTLGVANWFRS